jgi:hypothetical protein
MVNCTGDIPYNSLGISLAPMPCQSALNNLTAINTQTATGVAALEALHSPRTPDSIYNTLNIFLHRHNCNQANKQQSKVNTTSSTCPHWPSPHAHGFHYLVPYDLHHSHSRSPDEQAQLKASDGDDVHCCYERGPAEKDQQRGSDGDNVHCSHGRGPAEKD